MKLLAKDPKSSPFSLVRTGLQKEWTNDWLSSFLAHICAQTAHFSIFLDGQEGECRLVNMLMHWLLVWQVSFAALQCKCWGTVSCIVQMKIKLIQDLHYLKQWKNRAHLQWHNIVHDGKLHCHAGYGWIKIAQWARWYIALPSRIWMNQGSSNVELLAKHKGSKS